MFDQIINFLHNSIDSIPPIQIIFNMVVAAGLSLAVYATYYLTYSGVSYSKRFNVSLVMMALITATIMNLISNNITLSLGMVGALSIVRFRTAIKDPRDTAYIFWAIAIGIGSCTGKHYILVIGTVAIAAFAIFLNFGSKSDDKYLIIIRGELHAMEKVRSALFKTYRAGKLRAETVTSAYSEIVYQIKLKKDEEITEYEKIREIEGVDYVNLVAQNGETLG